MRVTWLAAVLRSAGLTVLEMEGWEGRGRELRAVRGIVAHHTASPPNAADTAVARLLRDGRRDLPGPLAQLGLDRAGRYWLVCDGKANHNIGEFGNDSIGIEAFNDGRGEPWPEAQMDAYVRGCAAIAAHLGLPVACVRGHKETDPGRKPDPTFDMHAFREQVARALQEDDDMRPPFQVYKSGGRLYLLTPWGLNPIPSIQAVKGLRAKGLASTSEPELSADELRAVAGDQR